MSAHSDVHPNALLNELRHSPLTGDMSSPSQNCNFAVSCDGAGIFYTVAGEGN